jgi:hypothetical protein
VVNPSQSFQKIELPPQFSESAYILFHDKGFTPVLSSAELMLGPEQLVVMGNGKFNSKEYQWGTENDVIIPRQIEQIDTQIQITDKRSAIVKLNPQKGLDIRVLFSQYDESGYPFRSWGGAPPNGTKMNEFLTITAKQSKKNIPVSINYDKMIWSGLSWASGVIRASDIDYKRPLEIICTSKEGESRLFKIQVYNVL